MKHPIISSIELAALVGVMLVTPAFATITIDYVNVGNKNNSADLATGSIFGSVGYAYQIAKNETTISQYCEFLNAAAKSDPYALYSTNMASQKYIAGIMRSGSSGSYYYSVVAGSANKPITYVSWFDAARFCNWMHNGQGAGSTEDGAYTLGGAMSGIYAKNVEASIWIPSENEWYKAAYYDATKDGTGGYWAHPTQSNTMTTNDIGVAGAANFYDANGYAVYTGSDAGKWGITDVEAYGANSDSFYGTNDQGGNVWEWNDAVIGSSRGLRGGSWLYSGSVSSSSRFSGPSSESDLDGFRVASSELAAVPEVTSSFTLFGLISSGLLLHRRTKHLR
jgi:formylglycine-generating enzyme required for sulfatase activity